MANFCVSCGAGGGIVRCNAYGGDVRYSPIECNVGGVAAGDIRPIDPRQVGKVYRVADRSLSVAILGRILRSPTSFISRVVVGDATGNSRTIGGKYDCWGLYCFISSEREGYHMANFCVSCGAGGGIVRCNAYGGDIRCGLIKCNVGSVVHA